MKLGNRTSSALEILLGSSKLAVVMKASQTLEISTRLSGVCCGVFCRQGAVPIIYSMIRSCNRSEPHLELLKFALSALRNVSRHGALVRYVAEPGEAVEVLVDLLQMFRDKETTFRLAAQVLHRVCKFKSKPKPGAAAEGPGGGLELKLSSDWLNADIKRRIKSILKLLARKHDMDKRTKKGSACGKSVALLETIVAFLDSLHC
jgi:hypothetical protein